MKNLDEIQTQLKELDCLIEPCSDADQKGLYKIYHEVISAGTNYPHDDESPEGFQNCVFAKGAYVYVCKSKGEVIGGFNLKPNFPGRGKHIANAVYMLQKSVRGKGIGKLLVEASLAVAKEIGYKGIQFNLVLSQNQPAVNLYKKVGFEILGTIPNAIRNNNGSYQSGYIMYKSLCQD